MISFSGRNSQQLHQDDTFATAFGDVKFGDVSIGKSSIPLYMALSIAAVVALKIYFKKGK